jgi:hypothetical protein
VVSLWAGIVPFFQGRFSIHQSLPSQSDLQLHTIQNSGCLLTYMGLAMVRCKDRWPNRGGVNWAFFLFSKL